MMACIAAGGSMAGMGRMARAKAVESFDIQSHVQKVQEQYMGLMGIR